MIRGPAARSPPTRWWSGSPAKPPPTMWMSRCRSTGAGREPARPRAARSPPRCPGFGSIPAGLADEIIGHTGGRRWWRRLFTAPAGDGDGRVIVGGDPAARRFTGWLAKLDHAAGPVLPGAVLHRPDPPYRPHRPGSATAAPPPSRTAAECASTTTTSGRCPATRSRSSASLVSDTPPSPPPRPDTTTSAAPPTHPDATGRRQPPAPAGTRRPSRRHAKPGRAWRRCCSGAGRWSSR